MADPVFVDASGTSPGAVSVLASQASGYITIVLPTAALGTVGRGWRLTVVLHRQDGFAPGRARGFAPTPQEFAFGVYHRAGPARSARSIPPRCPRRWM